MRGIVILFLAVSISAAPWQEEYGGVRPWSPPGPSDSRSPCPGLNTLANHGYLPHHGRNLTIQHFADAVHAAFNWDPAYGSVPAAGALALLGLDPARSDTTVDLEDLSAANRTEHRASLTRADAETGDASTLDPARLRALLDDAEDGGEADDDDYYYYVTVGSAARSRLRVQRESGPPFLTEAQAATARQEVSLLLMLMSDVPVPEPEVGGSDGGGDGGSADYGVVRAPKERVREWLVRERLPVELGWRPSERVLQLSDVFGVAEAILEKMMTSG